MFSEASTVRSSPEGPLRDVPHRYANSRCSSGSATPRYATRASAPSCKARARVRHPRRVRGAWRLPVPAVPEMDGATAGHSDQFRRRWRPAAEFGPDFDVAAETSWNISAPSGRIRGRDGGDVCSDSENARKHIKHPCERRRTRSTHKWSSKRFAAICGELGVCSIKLLGASTVG